MFESISVSSNSIYTTLSPRNDEMFVCDCSIISLYAIRIASTTPIAKIFVYKHCFCYLNVENVKQKNSLFLQPIALWLAH